MDVVLVVDGEAAPPGVLHGNIDLVAGIKVTQYYLVVALA